MLSCDLLLLSLSFPPPLSLPLSFLFPHLSTETLGIANVDYYWYLNQSGTYTVDGTDDKKEFADTLVSSNSYNMCIAAIVFYTAVFLHDTMKY